MPQHYQKLNVAALPRIRLRRVLEAWITHARDKIMVNDTSPHG